MARGINVVAYERGPKNVHLLVIVQGLDQRTNIREDNMLSIVVKVSNAKGSKKR